MNPAPTDRQKVGIMNNLKEKKLSGRRELIIVACLCVMGALRVFVFSAAFPFFNNVDEHAHLDMVWKYSQGQLPQASVEHYSRAASEFIILYGTVEYLSQPEDHRGGKYPPPAWRYPNVRSDPGFHRAVAQYQTHLNHEAGALPFYYAVAGAWLALGRMLGIEDGHLLYWIRFLNVPGMAALVWLAYVFARTFVPDSSLQRLGLPLLVAFLPQDVLYSINSDVLSPLLCGAAFVMLAGVYWQERSHLYYLCAGLVVAAAFLTKPSNIAVPAVLGVIVVLKLKGLFAEKRSNNNLGKLGILLLAAVIPVGAWLVRNQVVLGDISGSVGKIKLLGWTSKPLGQVWPHPIASMDGLAYFFGDLTKSFWRGEFVWHAERMGSGKLDVFYAASTAILLLAAALGLLLNWRQMKQQHRWVLAMSFLTIIMSVLFLAVLSMLYDFGNCWYPSRQEPFFVSGRLILGVLLPFGMLYLTGLGWVFSWIGKYLNPLIILGIVLAVITCSELWHTWPVFASPYNWFHLQ